MLRVCYAFEKPSKYTFKRGIREMQALFRTKTSLTLREKNVRLLLFMHLYLLEHMTKFWL